MLFYHLLAGLAIIAQLRCMLSDPGKLYISSWFTVYDCSKMYFILQYIAAFFILGYVPLPKTKLDFTELDAKPTKKVCYMCTV